MSVILFLFVLFVLVLVHEWGHYITAKKTGMRVDEFAIGFPPKLFSIKRGETEYSFNLFPIGGYVRIFGENKEVSDGVVDIKDVGRAFSDRPKWAQAVVLLAGITMNILFAWALFTVTFLVGVPTAVDEATASSQAKLYVAATLPGSPSEGVLPVSAVILSATAQDRSVESPSPSAFSQFVTDVAPQPITVSYEINNQIKEATLTPVAGLVAADPERYVVGTSLSFVENVKEPFFSAVFKGLVSTLDGFVNIASGLGNLLKDAVMGQADFSNIAGPVGIVGLVGDAAAFGIVSLLTFTAIISLNLAVINLLPFPALDGGRLVFVIIEAVTGKEVPSVWTGWINLFGFVILMLLMVTVTYGDIMRLL
jgi:regulator of sigma E protease